MKKVLAFGASNSKNSINKKLAHTTAKKIADVELSLIDLNDFPLPIYSIDIEKDNGIPENASKFFNLITQCDGLIISLAEHNSNVTAVFKNLSDWISRLEGKTWQDKKVLLLSTSPGGRGGASAMKVSLESMPYSGADIVAHFSLPKFNDNFSEGSIIDDALKISYNEAVSKFVASLK